MGLKHHTIIFVPHARARFRKWRVSHRQLQVAGAMIVLVLAASVFTTWSFFTNTIDRQELQRVRDENDELQKVNESFEESIDVLQGRLGEFEQRTRQLAIVAGLDSLATGQEVGIGGDTGLFADDAFAAIDRLQERAASLAGDLTTVEAGLDDRLLLISSTPAITPVKGVLTSVYGRRSDPITGARAWHPAIDIASSPGQPVRATADAVVMRSGRIGGLGKAVYLSHGFGITTRYGHLSRLSVEAGQKLQRGDIIGYVGSTGRATGYHLHYEVRVDGEPVNPLAYILDTTSGS